MFTVDITDFRKENVICKKNSIFRQLPWKQANFSKMYTPAGTKFAVF